MSTRDKYRRAPNGQKQQQKSISENEIRIRTGRGAAGYIRYALGILTRDGKDTVIIQSSGGAIPLGCLVAEIIRRRVPGLHQLNQISSTEIEDVYVPIEEGLDKIVLKKQMAVLRITLTKKGESLNKSDPGYQEPLPADQVRGLERRDRPEGEEGEQRPRGGYRGDRGDRGDRGERGGDRDQGDRPRRGGRGGGFGGRGRGGFGGGRGGRFGGGDRERFGGDRERFGGDRREGGERREGGGRREGGEGGRRFGGGDRRPFTEGGQRTGQRVTRGGGGGFGGPRRGGERKD